MAKTFKNIIVGIYKITSPSNKIYVGQSKHIEKRFYDYQRGRCEQQRRLFNSLFKHGWKNHTFEIIEECDKQDLNCRERYWQDFYDVLNREKGLNCVLTACGEKRGENITVLNKKNKLIKESNVGHTDISRKRSDFTRFKMSISRAPLSLEDKQLRIDNYKIGDLEIRLEEALRERNRSVKIKKESPQFHHKSQIILDTQTGIFYYSLRELCDLYKFNYNTMGNRLNGGLKNHTNFIYV